MATAAERDANPKVLSSFTGLYFDTTEPMTHADAAEHHGVQILRNYIFQILADGNQASYDYIIGWLAAGLQRLKKLGVILVLVGAPGAGKSHLLEPTKQLKQIAEQQAPGPTTAEKQKADSFQNPQPWRPSKEEPADIVSDDLTESPNKF